MAVARARPRRAAAHMTTLLGLFSINALVLVVGWMPILWFSVPAAGLALCGALSTVHECAHGTYFGRRGLDRSAGRLFALLLLMNFSKYRRGHLAHHAFLGRDGDGEPALRITSVQDLIGAIVVNRHALLHWRSLVLDHEVASSAQRRDSCLLALVAVGLLTASVIAPAEMMLVFWTPFVLGSVLDNVVSLPEHTLIGEEAEGPVTRTLLAPTAFEFLIYNVNNHAEHHNWPSVSAASGQAAKESSGYVSFYRAAFDQLIRKPPEFI